MASEIILDDGKYFIELNPDHSLENAPGVLLRRCALTPSSHECIGSFDRRLDGQWKAGVTVPYDAEMENDCHILAAGVARLDAIVALWSGRRMAV